MGDVAFLADLYGSSGCTAVNVIRCTKALNTVARMNFTPTGNNFYLHCLTSSMDMDEAINGRHQL